jgi:hypothetical protein
MKRKYKDKYIPLTWDDREFEEILHHISTQDDTNLSTDEIKDDLKVAYTALYSIQHLRRKYRLSYNISL